MVLYNLLGKLTHLTLCKSLAENGHDSQKPLVVVPLPLCNEFCTEAEGGNWDRSKCHLCTGACLEVCVSMQHGTALRQKESTELLRKSKPSPKYEIRPLATPTQLYKAPEEGTRAPRES